MEHKWMRKYIDGVWTGREDRMVVLEGGIEASIDDLAKQHGLDLPDAGVKPATKSKKTINTVVDIQEKRYEDLEGTLDSRHTEEHDGGDGED